MQPGTFSDPLRNRGRQRRSSTTSRRSTSPSLTHSQGNSTTLYHQLRHSESSGSHASPPASQHHDMTDRQSYLTGTNQNRMEAAIRHRSPSPQLPTQTRQLRPSGGISMNPFGTLPTITVPRDTNRENRSHRQSWSNTQPTSQSRRGNLNSALTVKYIFCINPAPVINLSLLFVIFELILGSLAVSWLYCTGQPMDLITKCTLSCKQCQL